VDSWQKISQKLKFKMQNYNSKFKSDLKTRCYRFSLDLIAFLDGLPNQRSVWIIADQLLRSGMSVGANLVEASASSSRLEFKKFHEIALKSANETKYWLGLLRDSGKANKETTNKLLAEVTEIANMIAAGVMKLKNKNF
jgi:four helix bundle protein